MHAADGDERRQLDERLDQIMSLIRQLTEAGMHRGALAQAGRLAEIKRLEAEGVELMRTLRRDQRD
jgi:hypothetical protein